MVTQQKAMHAAARPPGIFQQHGTPDEGIAVGGAGCNNQTLDPSLR